MDKNILQKGKLHETGLKCKDISTGRDERVGERVMIIKSQKRLLFCILAHDSTKLITGLQIHEM